MDTHVLPLYTLHATRGIRRSAEQQIDELQGLQEDRALLNPSLLSNRSLCGNNSRGQPCALPAAAETWPCRLQASRNGNAHN